MTLFIGANESIAKITFERERIDVFISGDTMEVSGIYYFTNNDSITGHMSIYYPFPTDSIHEYPHFIRLIAMSANQDTSYTKLSEGIGFNLTVRPGKTDSIKIIYRQRVYYCQGRYILTTTKYWNKPFAKAEYSITFPSHLTLNYWSFEFDSIFQNKGKFTYYAHRKNFMPKEDMIMKWQCE